MIKNKAYLFILYLLLPLAVYSQQAALRGRVTDSIGRPLQGVTIRLEPDAHAVQSSADGRFVFPSLVAGRYRIAATHTGMQPYNSSVLLKPGENELPLIVLHAAEQALSEISVRGSRLNADNIASAGQSAQVVMVITKEKIQEMGSRRLDEVLREQTGMAVVSDLGDGNRSVGIQMQGFSSEYITILLNGQPMGGRHSGNFDLSRISVADIERIEVIKGASCSFYGSEALGGTINIVTRQDIRAPRYTADMTGGSNGIRDLTLTGESPLAHGNGYAYLSGNAYHTDGFNVNPYLVNGKTAPPYDSYSLQGRGRYRLSKGTALNLTGRYSARNSVMDRDYGAMPNRDKLDERDLNLMTAMENNAENGQRWISRYYFTSYNSAQEVHLLSNNKILQQNNFAEYRHRAEVQHSLPLRAQNLDITSGTGAEYLLTRAETQGAGGDMLNYFAYSQVNWQPLDAFSAVAGLRYDANTVYGGRLNPTAGLSYQPFSWLGLKASLGTGFKSPTYAQLYQQFTNLSQGYTVLGANGIAEAIAALKAAGDIQSVWANATQVVPLKAETSTSWNLEATIQLAPKLQFKVNGFYNNIHNLIISQQIGIKSNGAQLFSWFNIASMYSRGIEANASWQPVHGLSLSAGYQLLDMKDRAVLASIKAGSTVRARGGIRKATTADYFGLPNRSRHMGNLQASYYYLPWALNVSVRASYRGKYGFLDLDNNGYIDPYDAFVKSYVLLNASVQKKLFAERLTLHLTAENIGGYTDYLMPGQPGRVFTAGLTWTLTLKKHTL